jgi:uncharacterized membrane protein HdeD (DUF308 family)
MRSINAVLMLLVLSYAFYADFAINYIFAIIFFFVAIGQLISFLSPDKEQ